MSTLTGQLSMLSAEITWRDTSVRCRGLFRSEEDAAFEVEWKVYLTDELGDYLAHEFLKAGVPVLRGSKIEPPKVELQGETLHDFTPRAQKFNMDGTPKIDRRRREWRDVQKAAEAQRLAGASAPSNGNNGKDA